MYRNYLSTALRNLWKYKGYSIINLLGLAVAFASAWMIYHYLSYHYSFDQYISNSDQVFLVGEQHPNVDDVWYYTRSPLLPRLLESYPEIQNGTRLADHYQDFNNGSIRDSERGYYADSSLLEVLDISLIEGNAADFLKTPKQVILTEKLAQKYFPNTSALHQRIEIHYEDHIVAGVIADFPTNSSLQADFLMPHMSREANENSGFLGWYSTTTMVMLRLGEHAEVQSLADNITELVKEQTPNASSYAAFSLLPIGEYHLRAPTFRRQLAVMMIIALAILIIAAINFSNLVLARALTRYKEIGVRKVVGASYKQLATQFLGEALLMSLLAGVVGVLLSDIFLPFFNELLELPIETASSLNLSAWSIFLLCILLVGIIAGLYPSFVLSKIPAMKALRGKMIFNLGGQKVRSGLIVTQFTLSIILIVGTLFMNKQIQFMKNKDLHIDTEQLVVVPAYPEAFENKEQLIERIPLVRAKLREHAQITEVSSSQFVPFEIYMWGGQVSPEGDEQKIRVRINQGDGKFFEVYGLEPLLGKGFTEEAETQAGQEVVINENLQKKLGYTDPIGKRISMPDGSKFTIAAVIPDFHSTSLETPIEPLVFFYNGERSANYWYLSIRLSPGPIQSATQHIHESMAMLDPNGSFEPVFLDESYQSLYESYEQNGQLLSILTLLAILIASMGLLGLVSFMTTRRTKEIGIRKVLGASVLDLLFLFLGRFTLLVVISIILSVPFIYWGVDSWLESFAYRIEIGPVLFLLGGLAMLLITWITVSYFAVKTSLANPVNALRNE